VSHWSIIGKGELLIQLAEIGCCAPLPVEVKGRRLERSLSLTGFQYVDWRIDGQNIIPGPHRALARDGLAWSRRLSAQGADVLELRPVSSLAGQRS